MNFIQRALRHLSRSKTKSLLLTLTFFLIANFVVVGFSISAAAAEAKIETRRKMNPVVEFTMDFDAWYEKYMSLDSEERKTFAYPKPDPELVRRMLADSRVKSADWTRSTLGYADGFAPVEIQRPQKTEDEEDDGMFSTSVVVSETMSGSGQATNQQPNMTLLGLLSPQLNKLADETWKLAQGRMITQEEIDNGSPVAVINSSVNSCPTILTLDTPRESKTPISVSRVFNVNALTREIITTALIRTTATIRSENTVKVSSGFDKRWYISSLASMIRYSSRF